MQGGGVPQKLRNRPGRRSTLERLDSRAKNDDYISSQDDYEDKERTKHVAELLDIMGASNINNAVKLQVEILKVQKISMVTSLIKDARREAAEMEVDVSEHHSTQGSLAVALMATKLKSRAAKVALCPSILMPTKSSGCDSLPLSLCRVLVSHPMTPVLLLQCSIMQAREKHAHAAEVVANWVFGENHGSKAGPLRWSFHRQWLLDIWEWKSFHAQHWQRSILDSLARSADKDFSDEKVNVLDACTNDVDCPHQFALLMLHPSRKSTTRPISVEH